MRKRGLFVCSNCEEEFTEAPTPTGRRGRVFLSYGHDSACSGLVERIRSDLHNKGFEVWIDRERINFGDDWRREITDGIVSSSHMIAFLSKHSTRSPGVCRQEIAIALGPLRGHIYTVLVEPLSEVTPPLIVSHLQWLDMHEWRNLQGCGNEAFATWYNDKLAAIIDVLRRNESFAGEIDALRQWLRPLDPSVELASEDPEAFSGRRWLLDGVGDGSGSSEIERWRTNPAEGRVFWLSAEPGWGKSCVSVRLAHVGRARVLAVHFCRKGQALTVDARQVMRTLAFQIATQLPEFRTLLIARLNSGSAIDELNAEELFRALLRQPLQYAIVGDRKASDRHLIVLDGIDEALDQHGHSALLDLIANGFQHLPDWIGLIVTSRPEAPIMRKLTHYRVRRMVAKDIRNRGDLEQHVRRWFARIGFEFSQSDRAFNRVLEAASGNFLYLRQLESAVDAGLVPLSALSGETKLPQGLSSLYHDWFNSKFPESTTYARTYRPVLEVMTASEEPLPIAMIEGMLGWDPYDRVSILEALGSLCPVDEGCLRFFHKSLPDWLNDPSASGHAWFVSIQCGHKCFSDLVTKALKGDHRTLSALPPYLIRYGAFHAARAGHPEFGAQFLNSVASAGLLRPGLLRAAVDRYLLALTDCDTRAVAIVSSSCLAQLITRTDTRQALTIACDLLLSRPQDWEHAFEHHPLDGRGATWVFASRWAHSILLMSEWKGRSEWLALRGIAVNPDHPLFLSAAYAFKFVALQRERWLDPELLAPLCVGWTYSRLVATNLLLQLALRGSEIPYRIPWSEFWNPVWEYNQIEVGLLASAMRWRGLRCDYRVPESTLVSFEAIEEERVRLASNPALPIEAIEAVEFYWDAGSDLERCSSLLRVLDGSEIAEAVLELYLGSPIFEASEVAASLIAARNSGRPDVLRHLMIRADPESPKAWGLFVATARLAVAEGDSETFTVLVKRFSRAGDAQLRGLAAMNLADYLRTSDSGRLLQWITDQIDTIRHFLHDTDIWPVQEIFHFLQECEDKLMAAGSDWRVTCSAASAPIVKTVKSWAEPECGWRTFEREATGARREAKSGYRDAIT